MSKQTQANYSSASLIATIGDEDTITGFLLAGTGQIEPSQETNYFIVSAKTTIPELETAFKKFVNRKDIAIILINQVIGQKIRHLLDQHDKMIPVVLEIPSKDQPYNPEQDSVMTRIKSMFGTA